MITSRPHSRTIKDVARELKLDWHTVKELDKEYMTKLLEKTGTPAPEIIGMDEVSIRKGHTYITVIPNTADTTVASSSNTYDRIQLSSSMASDYALDWGVIDIGQVYDVSTCEGTVNTAGTMDAISDHFPVWGELFVDRDED